MDYVGRLAKKVHSYFLPTQHNAYRPHLLRGPWLLFFLTVTLTAEGILLGTVFAGQTARSYLAAVLPGEVVSLTNLERGFNNLATLKENPHLDAAAQKKAEDMAAKGYFAHTGPDGKEPWAWINEANYAYAYAGENLAVRFNNSEDVVRAWMASPTHRANIIKPQYTEIGVGVAEGTYKGAPATFVVQYFGRPTFIPAVVGTNAAEALDTQDAVVLGAAAEQVARQDMAEMVAAVGAAPATQAFGILVAAAVVLIGLVALTVVVNIQVQPVELILGGVGVAAVAVAFLALNNSFVMPFSAVSQSASLDISSYPAVLLTEPWASPGIVGLPSGTEQSTLDL